jgi:hypothetical protein
MEQSLGVGYPKKGKKAADVIRDFFKCVVITRIGHRFDIHGIQGRGWKKDDVVRFCVARQAGTIVTATLADDYRPGGHGDADSTTDGHFFLRNICVEGESGLSNR